MTVAHNVPRLFLLNGLSCLLAGILALSTFLAEGENLAAGKSAANEHIPIFMCHGQHDAVLPMSLGNTTKP